MYAAYSTKPFRVSSEPSLSRYLTFPLKHLLGSSYLHINGFIHRDIKAANLLVDDDGTVLLGDLGVAADLTEDTSSHRPTSRALHMSIHHESTKYVAFQPPTPVTPRPKIGKRKSFVGTVRCT